MPVTGGSSLASSNADQLFGRAYVSTSITKGGEPHPVFEGAQITVEFARGDEHDSIVWRAGCNDYGGPVEITGGRLVTGQIFGTAVGCIPSAHGEEKWASHFFASDPKWHTRHGGRDLRLKVGWRVVKLRRGAADP